MSSWTHARNPGRIRLATGVAGIMAVACMGIGIAVDGAELVYVIVLLAISSVPFFLYIAFMRTLVGTVLTGAALVLTTLVIYASVFTSESSTSGLGLLVSPILNFLILAVGGMIDSLVRRKGD